MENFWNRCTERVQAVACGVRCTDLRNEAIKILGIYFLYNLKTKYEKKYGNIISNIQGVLNLWRMRSLTLEERIVAFKRLAIFSNSICSSFN